MSGISVLTCCVNSHPFQERRLSLSEPLKIGRSVAQARPGLNNAIFDCKVLSRNHALIWYENGKFFLQDTKSSNGTFVNSQRLSKGSEESSPQEIYSNDVLQFGVDVVENSRKGTTMHQITHSCIIASVQLFHPDGQEALQSASDTDSVVSQTSVVHSQDLHCLSQYIQEALRREQMLEGKLSTLQELVTCIQDSTDIGWQAMIDEDRFLSRLETLETQLSLSNNKEVPENVLKQRLTYLENEKYQYELTAKDSLKIILEEKLDANKKVSDLEISLKLANDEIENLEKLRAHDAERFEELLTKISDQNTDIFNIENKLAIIEKANEEKSSLDKDVQVDLVSLKDLQTLLDDEEESEKIESNSDDFIKIHEDSIQIKKEILKLEEEKRELERMCNELTSKNQQLANIQSSNQHLPTIPNQSHKKLENCVELNSENTSMETSSKGSKETDSKIIKQLKEELENTLEEYQILSYQTKIISFASALPLVLLVVAFILSFHQFFSSITATTTTNDTDL